MSSGIATISRSPVLFRRRGSIRKPSASAHQFEATKILSPPKCVHDRRLLFGGHHSFRSVVSDQRQSPPVHSQFVLLPRPRSLRANCTHVSSAPASHRPMLPAPLSANLHSMMAG